MRVAYTRTSTGTQDIQRQVDDLEAEYELDHVYIEEARSGSNVDRPEFRKMMDNLEDIDTIVASEASRLSRSLTDFIEMLNEFEKHNVAVETQGPLPDYDPNSKLSKAMIQIIVAVKNMELEMTRERIQSGVDRAKKQGKFTGRPPFGYKTNGKGYLVKDSVEWEILEAATADLMSGMSQAAVAANYEPLSQPVFSRILRRIEAEDELYDELYFDRREWEHAKVDA